MHISFRLIFVDATCMGALCFCMMAGTLTIGLAAPALRTVAFYGNIAGIVLLSAAAVTSAYHMCFLKDSRAASGDLLDVGIMFAAILLFAVNGILRQQRVGSALPLVLTVLGVVGMVVEFCVDRANAHLGIYKIGRPFVSQKLKPSQC